MTSGCESADRAGAAGDGSSPQTLSPAPLPMPKYEFQRPDNSGGSAVYREPSPSPAPRGEEGWALREAEAALQTIYETAKHEDSVAAVNISSVARRGLKHVRTALAAAPKAPEPTQFKGDEPSPNPSVGPELTQLQAPGPAPQFDTARPF